MSDFFASVSWSIEDIKSVKPDWTDEQCETFLRYEEDEIQSKMIQSGWETIKAILACYGDDYEKRLAE